MSGINLFFAVESHNNTCPYSTAFSGLGFSGPVFSAFILAVHFPVLDFQSNHVVIR